MKKELFLFFFFDLFLITLINLVASTWYIVANLGLNQTFSTRVITPVKQNKLRFSSIEINKLHPAPVCRSDSSSEAKSSCGQNSDAKSYLV